MTTALPGEQRCDLVGLPPRRWAPAERDGHESGERGCRVRNKHLPHLAPNGLNLHRRGVAQAAEQHLAAFG
jgi:hypothetical protein